ncbi:PIN domain-containing protein [Halomonas daqiaonensis]|uniref:Ribonuclease VapC n=1 Tax=Halomonas daqiaonensis TaxID=650850 RepID=A0A1H7W7F8_9GAMM|nr:PIN domain-containing protein [Halomonas daqiaonensis]SEM16995.1 tRNA(fMet)-specific endonuclease VapC [Halomonas daqiaonensis]
MPALDSNTISYYFRADPQVVTRILALKPSDLAVPAIVVYELKHGLKRLPDEASRPRLQALETLLQPIWKLPFDNGCADVAASLCATLERQGTPIGPMDILIAATAIRHRATLVTRKERVFPHFGTERHQLAYGFA